MWVRSFLTGMRTWSLMRRMRRGDMGCQVRRSMVAMLGLEDRVLALAPVAHAQHGAWDVERCVLSRCVYACYDEV